MSVAFWVAIPTLIGNLDLIDITQEHGIVALIGVIALWIDPRR